jgi:glycosyltransferase involved in cell wall biosynthesis
VGLEAMACGVPVISSDINGPREYVKNHHNGYLFELNNSTQLSEKILMFYRLSKKEKESMILNCLSTAYKYTSTRVNKKLNYFLNQLYEN